MSLKWIVILFFFRFRLSSGNVGHSNGEMDRDHLHRRIRTKVHTQQYLVSIFLFSLQILWKSLYVIIGYCYHLLNVITFQRSHLLMTAKEKLSLKVITISLAQNDHIKRLLLYNFWVLCHFLLAAFLWKV